MANMIQKLILACLVIIALEPAGRNQRYAHGMLVMLLILAYILAVAAVLSGIGIGVVAKSRNWPEKRIRWGAFCGTLVLLILGGLLPESVQRFLFPLLAKEGFFALRGSAPAFIDLLASVSLIALSGTLAGWVARRIAIPSAGR